MADNKTYKGTTSEGFEFEIEAERLDNMELIDTLAELDDGDYLSVSRLVTMLLGKDQKKRLYDFCRTETGVVPVEKVAQAFAEILSAHKETKNQLPSPT